MRAPERVRSSLGTRSTPKPNSAVSARQNNPARMLRERAGQRDPASLPNSCSRCGARWAGTVTAHCAGDCHRTFSGVGPFDEHRRDGKCLDPATLGMTLMPGRAYECWGRPSESNQHTPGEG
jgi:hypothetical protein